MRHAEFAHLFRKNGYLVLPSQVCFAAAEKRRGYHGR